MSDRFIKFIPSKEALYLARKHSNAFILLTFIAERARRENGHPDGLTIGQCYIGDWENMGLTRQQYRTALNILIVKKFVEITETCRTRKKSTTGSTTIGTLITLISSDIYDINSEDINHRSNHRPTTDQPPTNHEQEGIRMNKKEDIYTSKILPFSSNEQQVAVNQDFGDCNITSNFGPSPEKLNDYQTSKESNNQTSNESDNQVNVRIGKLALIPGSQNQKKFPSKKSRKKADILEEERLRFGEYVWFTPKSYAEICQELGKEEVHHFIDVINLEMASKGYSRDKYQDYVATIKKWRMNAIQWGTYKKVSTQSSQVIEDIDLIYNRREHANKIIKENWPRFKPGFHPRTTLDFVEAGNDKIYFNNPQFDERFTSSIRKAIN